MTDLLHAQISGELEVRAESGGAARLRGSFPYRKKAVLSDGGRRGRPQKEEFAENAFAFRVNDPKKEIHLLVGHSFDRPLASKLTGSLRMRDSAKALDFEATIHPDVANTSYGRDALAMITAGLAFGISPGFRLPPERAVPRADAETFADEEIDPTRDMHGARIRTIHEALLYEISIVTRPAYKESLVEARHQAEINAYQNSFGHLKRWRP